MMSSVVHGAVGVEDRGWRGRFSVAQFDNHARRAYYPFGKGQRRCIGEQMSLTIAQILIATVAQAYRVRLVPRTVVKPRYAITYPPKHGLPVLLEPR